MIFRRLTVISIDSVKKYFIKWKPAGVDSCKTLRFSTLQGTAWLGQIFDPTEEADQGSSQEADRGSTQEADRVWPKRRT